MPHGFVFLIVGAVASGESNRARDAAHPPGGRMPYCSNRQSPNLCKSCLPRVESYSWI